MKEIAYLITARSPLAINERKPGGSQYQEGLNYIPGRLVRGAVAAQVLRTCQDRAHERSHADCPDPKLCNALFGEEIQFHDARPSKEDREGPHLLPATATTCKDNAGFRSEDPQEKSPHGTFDTLLDRACWEALSPAGLQFVPRCPVCGGRTKAASGAYSRKGTGYSNETVSRELLVRVAINRRRAVAEDELLYAVNALSPYVLASKPGACQEADLVPACYAGTVSVPDDAQLAEEINKALQAVHHLGAGSSRGLGRVEVTLGDGVAITPMDDRIRAFNEALIRRWQRMQGLASADSAPQGWYFSATLQSDALLTADGWQPTMRLEPQMLWNACGEAGAAPADLELVRCYTTPSGQGGWQGAWGLPKETALAVQAGAVYLYRTTNPSGWDVRLHNLEERGVGERRAEGFGRVRICDPFHYEALKEKMS